METPQRSQVSCLDLLQGQAEEFNFYQAIRVLECVVREEEGIPQIRYKAVNEQAFMPNFIANLRAEEHVTEVKVNGYALTGQQGPLPAVYNDLLLEQKSRGNKGPEAFLDLFNNRFLHMLFDIKKKLDPMLFNDISINSEMFNILESLTGLTTFDLFKRLPITQEKLLTFSALLIGNRQNYSSLKQIIECMFDCKVEIEPCKGSWRKLPENWQTRLGKDNAILGSGVGLGKKHWDNQAKIGLLLTLNNIDQCRQLMPKGNLHEVLKSMLAYLTDGRYEIDVRLQLNWECLPKSQLSPKSSMFLGQSSWLKSDGQKGKTLNLPKFTVVPTLNKQFWEDVA